MIKHSDRTHAIYAASSSHRWMHCYGSIQRAAGMPPGLASPYALDGTEAHELLEFALTNGYGNAYEAEIMFEPQWEYRHDDHDTRIDSVQAAIDCVQDLIDSYAPDVDVHLETEFIFPTYNNDDAGGTVDVAVWIEPLDMLVVADFKHGAGIAVDVTENSQLMFYAVGARQELRRQGKCNSGKTLYRLVIMQPRGWHKDGTIREWVTTDERLDNFIWEVNQAINKSKEQMPEIVPGKWCKFCPALAACPEAETWRMNSILPTYKSMDDLRSTGLPMATDLSAQRISEILEM